MMATPTASTLIVLPPRSGMPAVDQNGVFTPEWMNFFHQQASPKINYIGANFIGQITTSPSTQGITVAQQSGTNAYQVSIGLAQNLESISTIPNSSGALVNNGSGSYTYTPIPQGTITSISIATANGFSGTVATTTTTPVITLSTTISGILKGSAGALVAAVAGTDYLQSINFTQGSVLYAGATGTFAQDNANLFYNPTGYASMPTAQFGPRGTNPIDAGFEFYVSSGMTAHFHNVNTTQSFTGGVTVELCYSPAGAAVQTGNRVGSLEFAGSYNTSDNVGSCAAIRSYSQDNFTSTTLGGNLVFQTVPSGTSTLKTALTLGSDQSAIFTQTVATAIYAVASLPAGVLGMRAMVNNALAPTFGATVVAGGLVTVPVYYDGTSWKVG